MLCYAEYVLVINERTYYIIQLLRKTFRLNGDKSEELNIYLGIKIQVVEYAYEKKCWSMSLEEYMKKAIKMVEAKMKKE